jgi:membrane-bound serine protease (ClpP class)
VRNLPRRLAILGILLLMVGAVAPSAVAQQPGTGSSSSSSSSGASSGSGSNGATPESPSADDGLVTVIQVSGYLDPIEVSFIERSITQAEADRVDALVVQLDSPGAVVDDAELDQLVAHEQNATVTIGVWVGPSGAEASGGAARVVEAAKYRGLAPGSIIEVDEQHIGADEAFTRGVTNIPASCDRQRGSSEGCSATIGDFVVSIPGVPVNEITQGDQTRKEPAGQTKFAQVSLVDRLMHSVASPPVAYLLFVIGMALLIFELFTAGVGVAGVVGAGAFLLGCYGLAVLPSRPVAIALLVFAMFGYAVDIQTGVPRVWTGIATVAFVIGSLTLYDGLSLSWITLLIGIVGMTIAMLSGMPAMVRARFSTPTIGREWMVGEEGEARTAVSPEGVVVVRGATWRARTNRATPISPGDQIRVAAIDGLVLDVEPLTGAARDYRERRSSHPS